MSNYRVGQVLYVVLRKEASVYPMQVVKEVTEKTLEGEVVTHMVRAGADPQKVLAITDIDGEIFDSAEKAKKVLIERVSNSISQRVDNAVSKAKEWYPSGFEHASDDPLSIIKKTAAPGVAESRPATQPPKPPKRQPMKPEVAALAAELAEEAQDQAVLQLPDGSTAKVKSVKLPPELQS